MTRVEYSSNNSGGSWWLGDEDWFNLEKAGWKVDWAAQNEFKSKYLDKNSRYMAALATEASREGLSLKDAISEWENITGQQSNDLGCSCCGTPHNFSFYQDDKYVDSYSPSYPSQGDRYECQD